MNITPNTTPALAPALTSALTSPDSTIAPASPPPKTSAEITSETAVDDVAEWLRVYEQARDKIREFTEKIDELKKLTEVAKQKVIHALGNPHLDLTDGQPAQVKKHIVVGTVGGQPAVRYTVYRQDQVQLDRLRADQPALVRQYTVAEQRQRFSITGLVA